MDAKGARHFMIYSRAHNCVVYDHAFPEQVCAAIAGARKVNGSTVAVPADLFSLQLARVLGLPVPNLLELSQYDFPIQPGRKPLSHQKYMADFMVLHPRAFNLSDMGTMKTLAMLWAADFLMARGTVKKALIVTPLSTVKEVWANGSSEICVGAAPRSYCTVRARSASVSCAAMLTFTSSTPTGFRSARARRTAR